MALYFHAKSDPQWKHYAAQAETILERTTLIVGHNRAHDIALQELRNMSEKNTKMLNKAIDGDEG